MTLPVRRVLENRFQNRDTTIEEAHLSNLFGAGVMAAYRGPRLYDAEETRTVVARWVAFYKKYRARLDSDIIHIRRADGRDIDGFMRANSQLLREKGLAMFFNPTDSVIEKSIRLPLYYTGLTQTARIRREEGPSRTHQISRDYTVDLPVRLDAGGVTWFVVEQDSDR